MTPGTFRAFYARYSDFWLRLDFPLLFVFVLRVAGKDEDGGVS